MHALESNKHEIQSKGVIELVKISCVADAPWQPHDEKGKGHVPEEVLTKHDEHKYH
jgi:hypothetical protein